MIPSSLIISIRPAGSYLQTDLICVFQSKRGCFQYSELVNTPFLLYQLAFPSKEFVSDVISIPEGINLSSLNQGISLLVGIL